tara:strand:+ start:359 stop:466 length:108 start_codon:yes stop_codon:yes gene_type:complete
MKETVGNVKLKKSLQGTCPQRKCEPVENKSVLEKQ